MSHAALIPAHMQPHKRARRLCFYLDQQANDYKDAETRWRANLCAGVTSNLLALPANLKVQNMNVRLDTGSRAHPFFLTLCGRLLLPTIT